VDESYSALDGMVAGGHSLCMAEVFHGNGFIAAFFGGLILGTHTPIVRERIHEFGFISRQSFWLFFLQRFHINTRRHNFIRYETAGDLLQKDSVFPDLNIGCYLQNENLYFGANPKQKPTSTGGNLATACGYTEKDRMRNC